MSTPGIRYLLPLLDDENEAVFEAVKHKIMDSGPKSIPLLENALNSSNSLMQHERIEGLIFQLRMLQVKERFVGWIRSANRSLQEGWTLIGCIQGNEIDQEIIEKLVLQITRKIWLELNNNQTSIEKIAIINRIFFEFSCFKINHAEVPVMEDYFFDKVLISRHGDVLSMNTIYAILARKLDLPMIPVNLGQKILLAYYDPVLSREAFVDILHPFLFFIDLEDNGKIIGVKEFEFMMGENQLTWHSGLVLTNIDLVKKLLQKIKRSYLILRDKERAVLADQLLNCLESA